MPDQLLSLGYRLLQVVGPLGEIWIVVPLAGALAVWCLVSRQPRGALALVAVTAATLVLVVAMKLVGQLIGPRWQPHWDYISSLFPSGHAAMGTVVYGALAICLGRADRRLLMPAATVAAVVVALLGAQRVAFHVHPWLDVVGGVALGAAALWALVRLWPSGGLTPIGVPASTLAVALIVHSFYGREIDSARMVERAAHEFRAAVAAVHKLAQRD